MIFQSTLPVRGATVSPDVDGFPIVISIHAPRVGSDCAGDIVPFLVDISIHAPREGSDLFDRNVVYGGLDFNPRSP